MFWITRKDTRCTILLTTSRYCIFFWRTKRVLRTARNRILILKRTKGTSMEIVKSYTLYPFARSTIFFFTSRVANWKRNFYNLTWIALRLHWSTIFRSVLLLRIMQTLILKIKIILEKYWCLRNNERVANIICVVYI